MKKGKKFKQRKLRKCEKGLKTKSLIGRGFRHVLGANGFMPVPH